MSSYERMVVKIQLPLESNMEEPEALVYNADRTFETFVPLWPELVAVMKGELKRYFVATWHGDGQLELHEEVKNPGW